MSATIKPGDIVRTPMGRRALVSAIAGNVAHLVYLPGKLYKRGDGHKCDDDFVSLRIKLLTFDEG